MIYLFSCGQFYAKKSNVQDAQAITLCDLFSLAHTDPLTLVKSTPPKVLSRQYEERYEIIELRINILMTELW